MAMFMSGIPRGRDKHYFSYIPLSISRCPAIVAMPVRTHAMDARYWNEALETRPWVEVERWQAQQIAEAVPAIRARSAMVDELHRGLPATPRFDDLAGLAALPVTAKDRLPA